jgi:hypothetical protein
MPSFLTLRLYWTVIFIGLSYMNSQNVSQQYGSILCALVCSDQQIDSSSHGEQDMAT